ncbi:MULTISPECIES: ABC transporter permease [Halolamina]|uniref:Peptide/nickel transport system permease protein n=1 Tax=Halolamina pelagica TaxID=699431 RepID=A0A1I5NGR7_9EURY|nr:MULTISPECIES: ABC transporter permease [Halolamina]NHX36307.1 ABC transporter permease [Halolamina sp. R1-12]SFP21025.1 peptide/nickel transport system permease protein [Halolamina pelagica]
MSDEPSTDADRFESIDWSEFDADDTTVGVPRWLPATAALLVVAFAYDYLTVEGVPLEITGLDWLLIAGLFVLGSLIVIPATQSPEQVGTYWAQFRQDRLAVAALGYLGLFFLVGLFGPFYFNDPRLHVLYSSQPPVWGSIDPMFVPRCYGPIVDGRCQGTWDFPLGTNAIAGKDVVTLLVLGTRTSLSVVLGAAAIVVPTGVGVGVVAESIGGRVETVLMWLAEQLQTFPAILIYFLLFFWMVEGRLRLLIAVLGFVSWGGLARLVRNEIRVRRNEQYVQAARLGGVDDRRLLGRHLLPNIAPSVLTNVTLQVPLFVLIEVSVSFIVIALAGGTTTLGDPTNFSWGEQIYNALFSVGAPAAWWLAGFPLLLLFLTVFAFNVVGDAMVDALEPRSD